MPGELTLGDLATAVAEGAIDTVVVAQTDMQGRLMGKRFQAEFFLESGHRETHGCNYLLSTDYEMETVPGLQGDELGGGLRRLHHAAGPLDAAGDAVARGHGAGAVRRARPPWPCRGAAFAAGGAEAPDRPARRAGPRADDGLRARVLPVHRLLCRDPRRRIPRDEPDRPVQRGLSRLPDHQGGGGDAGDPHRAERCGHPGRVVEGRGECRTGGDQRPLCRRPLGRRRPCRHQERGEGDRLGQGQVGHLHGQVRRPGGGLVVPHPPVAAARGRERGLPRSGRAARHVGD